MRAWKVVQPDGTSVTNVFLPTGEIGLTYGSRNYPTGYSFDSGGRMKTMTNWSSFASCAGARVTTWNYDPQRGWLTGKQYADGQGPPYPYTPAVQHSSRASVISRGEHRRLREKSGQGGGLCARKRQNAAILRGLRVCGEGYGSWRAR